MFRPLPAMFKQLASILISFSATWMSSANWMEGDGSSRCRGNKSGDTHLHPKKILNFSKLVSPVEVQPRIRPHVGNAGWLVPSFAAKFRGLGLRAHVIWGPTRAFATLDDLVVHCLVGELDHTLPEQYPKQNQEIARMTSGYSE